MASAPVVQSLNDLVSQITAAQQPQYQMIDKNISDNETSGQGQVAGLNAAKDAAFGKIEQGASNKGMYFSGFSPNAEAGYTGSTYLPALAKLQSTIAATRNTLLGQKTGLQTAANTDALNTQKGQQSALDAYNLELQREQAAAEAQARAEAAAERQAQIAASARVSAAAGRAPSAAATKQGAISQMGQALQGVAGRDGYVSPQSFAQARNEWVNAGYSATDFNSTFRNYANLTYGGASAGGDYGLKR